MILLAALAFAIAVLMHLFGWSHGHVDVTLLCLALSGCSWGWLPVSRRRDGT